MIQINLLSPEDQPKAQANKRIRRIEQCALKAIKHTVTFIIAVFVLFLLYSVITLIPLWGWCVLGVFVVIFALFFLYQINKTRSEVDVND